MWSFSVIGSPPFQVRSLSIEVLPAPECVINTPYMVAKCQIFAHYLTSVAYFCDICVKIGGKSNYFVFVFCFLHLLSFTLQKFL